MAERAETPEKVAPAEKKARAPFFFPPGTEPQKLIFDYETCNFVVVGRRAAKRADEIIHALETLPVGYDYPVIVEAMTYISGENWSLLSLYRNPKLPAEFKRKIERLQKDLGRSVRSFLVDAKRSGIPELEECLKEFEFMRKRMRDLPPRNLFTDTAKKIDGESSLDRSVQRVTAELFRAIRIVQGMQMELILNLMNSEKTEATSKTTEETQETTSDPDACTLM